MILQIAAHARKMDDAFDPRIPQQPSVADAGLQQQFGCLYRAARDDQQQRGRRYPGDARAPEAEPLRRSRRR